VKNAQTANSSKLILLGEDDIDDQEFLKEIFLSIDSSYQLKAISDGKKIINYLESLEREDFPLLIILDYNLPEMNGAEVLEILRRSKRYDDTPKIIWSTSNSAVYKSLCLGLGASDYVVKPGDVTSFVEAAKYMLSFAKS
jgi:CheY-like chemotaxis protein